MLIFIWALTHLLQSQRDSHAIIFIVPTIKLALQELNISSTVFVSEIKIHHSDYPLRGAKRTDSLICHSLDLPLSCHPSRASPSGSHEKKESTVEILMLAHFWKTGLRQLGSKIPWWPSQTFLRTEQKSETLPTQSLFFLTLPLQMTDMHCNLKATLLSPSCPSQVFPQYISYTSKTIVAFAS